VNSVLGTGGLVLGSAASVLGALTMAVGLRRRRPELLETGWSYSLLLLIGAVVAVIGMQRALITRDFTVAFVHDNGSSRTPALFNVATMWSALEGSILLWVLILSGFTVHVARKFRARLSDPLVAGALLVMFVVAAFFFLLTLGPANPFGRVSVPAGYDGPGPNPLLQEHILMAFHPPMLYLGFVGFTVPFAFALSALATGRLGEGWLIETRRATLLAWGFLTIGIVLGAWWSYEVLGWGGYWGWDPVENAGLLPWFTATAFLHSVRVQEQRGMLRVWNVTLVITTFFLTIFGTFMTRSGVVQSVHAFGEDIELARMFTVFMVTILVFSFGFVIYRLPLLRARNELDSWVSREAAFLANNWILLFSAFFVLFATMFPTLSEAVTGERLTVGPPFFNKWMLPVGLMLLLLTGVGPLLAWRKSTVSNLRDQFLFPVAAALVVSGTLVALGVRVWTSGICFAFCAFVMGTITQEFWRGARVRQGVTRTDIFTALIGLTARNKRRYGGYIVHVGIVLIFLGFAGEGFKQDEQVLLRPGQQATVGDFTVRLDAVKVTDDGQKQMITGHTTVTRDGEEVAKMYPAKWYFRKHEDQPTTEVAIRRSFAEDIYLVMPAFNLEDQSASMEIVINPLVNWVWVGFGILALGTGIALLPETVFAFAMARVPANAATASLLLLCAVLWPTAVIAQAAAQDVPVKDRSALQRRLEAEIMCTCGCKSPMGSCPMRPNCGHYDTQEARLKAHIAEGMDYDAIKASFVREFGGQDVLAAPLDRGFNRLAWLLPYLVATLALGGIVISARRWSRQSSTPAAAADTGVDAEMSARLDDELRNLD
jgi:cytochrome c-type biogenesis protein CcmF